MSPHQIQLVQNSWDYFITNTEEAGNVFYGRLFDQCPHLKPLFKDNMRDQERKLISLISFAVTKLKNLEDVIADVQALGTRHKGYGIKDEYYSDVADALLWTLERGLGTQWNDDVKDAWTMLYVTLSGIMINAPIKLSSFP